MRINSSANQYGRPRRPRGTLGGRRFNRDEIDAFVALHADLTANLPFELETSRRREAWSEPGELQMIQPGIPSAAEAGRINRGLDDSTIANCAFLTEDEHKAQLADIFLKAFLALDRVNVQRARSRAEKTSDPLQIRNGQYARRERWLIGDVSPQRYVHAKSAGSRLAEEAIEVEETPTPGVIRSSKRKARVVGKRKRIIARLEVLHNQGKIDDDEMCAARLFQAASVKSFESSIGLVAKYGGAQSPGHSDLLPGERIAEHGREVADIFARFSKRYHAVLHWIAKEAYRDVSLEMLGNDLSKHLRSRQSKCAHAIRAIKHVLTRIAEFYRIKDRVMRQFVADQ